MLKDPSTDETVVIATYGSWDEAQIAKSFLEDAEIISYIVGEEPHRGPEFAEGLRLRVLASRSETALAALRDADLLPSGVTSTQEFDDDGGSSGRLIFWAIVLAAALAVVAMVAYG